MAAMQTALCGGSSIFSTSVVMGSQMAIGDWVPQICVYYNASEVGSPLLLSHFIPCLQAYPTVELVQT